MKKSLGVVCLFIAMITLTGCPYTSDYPIDTPSVKISPSWYGKYYDDIGATNMDYAPSTLTINPKSEYEYKVDDYYITKDSMNMDEEHRNTYSAYLSVVKGKNFVNVYQSGDSYYIYKVDVKGVDIILTEIIESWKKRVSNSKELKDFLGKHLKNDLLFGDVVTLKRK